MGLKKKKPFLLTLADIALFIGPILLFVFVVMALFYRVELSQCPADTFLAGTTKEDLQLVGLVGLCLSLTFCFRHLAITRVPALNATIGKSGLKFGDWWIWVTLGMSLSFAALGVMASLSVYCLGKTKITYRDSPQGPMQSYVWQDIAGVQTGCHHYMGFRGRGRDNIAYNLVMRDGAVINIMDNPRYTEAVWPAILAQLDNVPFWFNHAAVEPRCAFPREDLLLTRP